MSRFKTVATLGLGLALVALAQPAPAQEAGAERNAPPQILTSDLAPRTQLKSGTSVTAEFVVVDSDNITEVTINGEPQTFEPNSTVVLSKTFDFTEPVTRIVVRAVDEAGHDRTAEYLVALPGVTLPEESTTNWFAQVGVAFEVDDNPSNDLSTPIDVGGLEVEGVVADSEQEDTRLTLRLLGGLIGGQWNAYVGAMKQDYTKSENENFETTMLFVGGGLRSGGAREDSWVLRYQFADIDIGSFDYSQQHTLSPGYEFVGREDEGLERDLLGLDIIMKSFAEGGADDVVQYTLRWNTVWRDDKKQDSYRSVLRIGNGSEGFEESEHMFFGYDQDSLWRWDGGFRMEFGFGYEYRDYPNDEPLSTDTPLGDTRVDNLLRLSVGPGWQFTPSVYARFGYKYTTNLSNKSPYVRQIYGLTVQATF